jgi:hypothetical protein
MSSQAEPGEARPPEIRDGHSVLPRSVIRGDQIRDRGTLRTVTHVELPERQPWATHIYFEPLEGHDAYLHVPTNQPVFVRRLRGEGDDSWPLPL